MHAFGREADEVPEVVMGGLRLRKSRVWLLLDRVNQVRKLDRILDKEDRNIVADNVPVTLLRVELYSKASDISRQIERPLTAGNGREANERRCSFSWPLKQVGSGVFRQRLVVFEKAVRRIAAGMHDPFRNTFVIKMEDLVSKVEILQQRRSTGPNLQGILIVRDRSSLRSG